MTFAKTAILALAIGAGLVGTVSLADAQMSVVEQKLAVFRLASLRQEIPALQSVVNVLANAEIIFTPGLAQNAASGVPAAVGMMNGFAQDLQEAIRRRDIAAKELGEAILAAMKTMNPNNQQDMKRLDDVFDEIQAINKTTNDAILRYDERLVNLKEQVAAGTQAQ
jgi:hypothetical protein